MGKEQATVDAINLGNGMVYGDVAQRLLMHNMDPGALRPFIGDKGGSHITINGNTIVHNAATLRKDEWKQMDDAVLAEAQLRMIGAADLYSRNLVYNISNGLGTTVLETENLSDFSDAEMNMDAVTRGRDDRKSVV